MNDLEERLKEVIVPVINSRGDLIYRCLYDVLVKWAEQDCIGLQQAYENYCAFGIWDFTDIEKMRVPFKSVGTDKVLQSKIPIFVHDFLLTHIKDCA